MDLYYIILTLCLILLILITALVDDKKRGYGYFLIILFVFLVVHRYVKDRQNKELFVSRYIERFVDTTEATDALAAAVAKDNQIVELQNQLKSLEKDIGDLTDVVRQRALNTALDDTSEARDFSLLESQKKQDQDLDKLESELDVLLKLYRKETEEQDKVKYDTLPVFSSCKLKEEGMAYLREANETQNYASQLETEEMIKNLGVNSRTSAELLGQMNKQQGDNINFNLNLV